ncbi:MAG: TetR family transcriptional regulator [Deltaproteobacteria bacterium]|nr:TetR family transcriptional regulator [Deltaproteobacteria bacterium]
MIPKPTPTPGRKTSRRKEEIIATAIDYIYEYGYQRASLRDMARQMGITQAALYYHFRNKEEILYTIIDRAGAALYSTLLASLSSTDDPLDNLKAAIVQQILCMKLNRKGIKILVEDKRFLSGDLKEKALDKEKAIFYLFKDQLQQLQEAKRIRTCDLTAATFGIFGMINWLYHWYQPEKEMSLDDLAQQIVNLLFHGLLPDLIKGRGGD